MRISWLEPEIVRETRGVLVAWNPDFSAHFDPEFQAPPPPPKIAAERWLRVAEHVARAERVGQAIRDHGLDQAIERFHDSPHAIELATLIAACVQVDEVRPDLVVSVLGCAVDDLVVYGPFLQLLEVWADAAPGNSTADRPIRDDALAVYEQFCAAVVACDSDTAMWRDRVNAVRDGLASFYVRCGRPEQGHALFAVRHEEDADTLLVALAASRTFLSAGDVARAIVWVGLGADRADALGRGAMADKLRAKQTRLRARLS